MRFMMIIKSDAKAEAGVLPDEKTLAEMGKFNEQMTKAGVMLGGEGLKASSKGSRVRLARGKYTVIDGPFAEARELIAGYWLIQVQSKEEAIEWARRVPGADGEVELRLLYELSDFPVDPSEQPEGWRDQEKQFRDAVDTASPAAPARKAGTKRFIAMIKSDKMTESGAPPDQKVMSAMGDLMGEIASSGALLSGEGLKPSSKGTLVRFSGSKRTVLDGPFTETKELIAGYTMIQVKSREEAIAFAKRWLAIHAQGSGEPSEIEIRELYEMSDFDPAS